MENTSYEVVELENGGWRIEDGGVRTFLFAGEEKALLVDTGFGNGNIKELAETLTDKPIMLVNTHADGDHVGCNALFDKAYMHPAEFPYYYETLPRSAETAPLWEGDVIDIGGRKFEVVLIPGHTPGSIALLDRENRFIITGDSVGLGIFMFGNMRSLRAHRESMRKLLKMSDSFDAVYPSHGPLPAGVDLIEKVIESATRILAGDCEILDPPFEMPAKTYKSGDIAFFYDERA